jgi:hypothetical protein
MSRRALIVTSAALLAAGAPAVAATVAPASASPARGSVMAGARSASAPRVPTRIVGRHGTVFGTRTVTASGTTVRVGRKRCAVASGTPLAALLAARRAGAPAVKLADYGSCSRRAADGGGLYVTQIGRDRRGGMSGWVYSVNGRIGTAGAADPAGPFGRGPLRGGQHVLWFWCRDASRCQ